MDARRYLPEILSRRGIDSAPDLALLEALLTHIQPLEHEWLEDFKAIAQHRLHTRDPEDWPVLAAALALSCPIWTQDTDFFGIGIATWTTEHIQEYLSD